MIDPKAITTYAQYNEDLILLALLHDVEAGFYVDVGANYPIVDSVTKLFYDKGWIGINIEPIESLYKQFLETRPKDINLRYGAGKAAGKATLREYTDISGHSTFNAEQKKQHDKSLKYTDYEVDIRALKEIFEEYKIKHIHFLKIDVEGFEYEVVAGNDWTKYRPEVVCIEANHESRNWQQIIEKNKYRFFIADGLNEYYVADEAWQRTNGFAERIIGIDYHALKQHQRQSWAQDSKAIEELSRMAAVQEGTIKASHRKIQELELVASLSLKNRPFRSRLKRSVYGLTVDWVKYRRGASKQDR
jgi:FkbM family methyltransferase